MKILWEPGEGFEVFLQPTTRLQPRTLITYFPALPYWADDRLRDSVSASSATF